MICKSVPVLAKLLLTEKLQVRTRISGQNMRKRKAGAPSNPEGVPGTLESGGSCISSIWERVFPGLSCAGFIRMTEDVLKRDTKSEKL